MATNLPSSTQSNTVRKDQQDFFEQYYDRNVPIDGSKYDAVVAFFEARTNNQQSAKALATALLEISKNIDIDPMIVIDDFKKYQENESFRAALIGLFNSSRRNTSKLGYAPERIPAPQISRNIRS